MQANTSPSSARKLKSSADMDRLKEIFFQLQDVRDDSQQRGWAVHDDLQAITEYLSELLQILVSWQGEGGRGGREGGRRGEREGGREGGGGRERGREGKCLLLQGVLV